MSNYFIYYSKTDNVDTPVKGAGCVAVHWDQATFHEPPHS
jgi:hypothetical protein